MVKIKDLDSKIDHRLYWEHEDWNTQLEEIKKIITLDNNLIIWLPDIISEKSQVKLAKKFISENNDELLLLLMLAGCDSSFHMHDNTWGLANVGHWAIQHNKTNILHAIIIGCSKRSNDSSGNYRITVVSKNRCNISPIEFAVNYENYDALTELLNNLPDEAIAQWLDTQIIDRAIQKFSQEKKNEILLVALKSLNKALNSIVNRNEQILQLKNKKDVWLSNFEKKLNESISHIKNYH